MSGLSPSRSIESERAEWEVVLAGLSRTPRLANLLRYIGELYFQNRSDEINEFLIATKVFGRSENTFDPSRDSIARVEAHRLRKKLKEYYETEGKDHQVVVSLPSGSYVLCFYNRSGSVASQLPSREPADAGPEAKTLGAPHSPEASDKSGGSKTDSELVAQSHLPRARVLLALILATSLVVAGVIGLRRFVSHAQPAETENAIGAKPTAIPPSVVTGQVAIRLLCGYDGTPRIDSSGAYWEADRYYSGGIARSRPDKFVTRTSDPMLFEHWRLDDFTYDIPLSQGPYELHLFFIAPQMDEGTPSSFAVLANDTVLLNYFNIADDALGANVADERIFKDIYPAADGKLHLKFSALRSAPSLNAIELVPGLPHKQLPVRLVTQRTAVTDHQGNVWHPDTYYQNGHVSDLPQSVSGTSEPSLYAYERYGHFTYSIPVDTRSRYTLVLHFAELYWVADPGVGQRIFRVSCNGYTLLDNFDIFKEAGSLHAVTKTFSHLRPSPEGKFDLTFEPIANNATISAIEVIDESE